MSGKRAKLARRLAALRKGFVWGYTAPNYVCEHEPPCCPSRERCLPQPKQAIAHNSPAEVLFFGGAVGGGKTEYDIVEAVSICLEHKNVQVAIFRRFHEDLKKNIITRLREVLPDYIATYNSQDHAFYFFTGSIIWMCHCRYEHEVYRYQGLQIVALFIDEASHFTEFMVKYLITRVRSVRGIRKRIRLTSNPGNVGHGWLKRWFVRPVPEELGSRPAPEFLEVWRPLPLEDDPTPPEDVLTRQFIPAYFRDNLALAKHDPRYLSQVYALGKDKAKQLAEGDWDANDSMIVGKLWRATRLVAPTDTQLLRFGLTPGQVIPWHVVQKRQWRPPEGAIIFGSVDYGFGAPWSFHLHAALAGGHVRTFFEYYMAGKRDEEQAQMIRDVILRLMGPPEQGGCHMSKPEWLVLDPSMWGSREEVKIAKSIAEVYADYLQPICQLRKGAGGRGARVSRPNRWMAALQTAADGLPFWTVTTACPDLIRTVPEVPWDEEDKEVEDDKSENHCIGEGALIVTRGGQIPIEEVVAGDEVLTRNGFRVVERAWQASPMRRVYEIRTDDGRRLRATGDHDIWTENRGWVRVDGLAYEDILLTDEGVRNACRKRHRWSFPPRFKNGAAFAITSKAGTLLVSAGRDRWQSAWGAFIDTCTRTCTALSLLVSRFITQTRTDPITRLETLNCDRTAFTNRSTVSARHDASAPRADRTSAWLKEHVSISRSTFRSCVLSAAAVLCGRIGTSRNDTAVRRVDVARVIAVVPSGTAPVYDLSVRDVHEFIADGILVSNCYEDVGRFFEARPFVPPVPPPDPYDGLDPISRAHHQKLEKRRAGSHVGGAMGVGNLARS